MIEKFKESFKEEASELLGALEEQLLELEQQPDNLELVSALFRAMHTIKGSAAMFGFEAISQFTHHIESVYDKVRSGVITPSRRLIDLTLKARDLITEMLTGNEEAYSDEIEELTQAFLEFSNPVTEQTAVSPESLDSRETPSQMFAVAGSEEKTSAATYRIRFLPKPELFKNGTNPFRLLDELYSLGTVTVVALQHRIPSLFEMDPESCYMGWDITITTEKSFDAIKDVFIFVEDLATIEISPV
ncbi:MAG: Hpt domain-containing protein, partial [Termitinemataceae bacterium]